MMFFSILKAAILVDMMGDNEASCGRRTRRGLYSRISTFFTTELVEKDVATRRKLQTQDVLMFLDAKFGQNVPPVRKDVLPGAHAHTHWHTLASIAKIHIGSE